MSAVADDRTAVLLGDLLATACDDERVHLPPGATRRLAVRVAELLAASGYRVIHCSSPALRDEEHERR